MIDRILSELKKDGKGMVIRGLIIAFSIDIFCTIFKIESNIFRYGMMILIVVLTTPGMGLIKRK
ncbi:MAG: hypothetical protein U9N10_01165 [Bacillota bacterium]|nr:hypothetical protein [Bacillota bacterium]